MGLSEVSNILWQERHLLELLVFKLDEQQLLLAAGRTRWLALAADELDAVMGELRQVELLRAIEVDGTAEVLGLPSGPSLAELAAAAPDPWDDLLQQHRAALLALAEEVRDRSAHNCELLGRGEAAVRELLLTSATSRADEGAPVAGLLLDQAF
jgi:hypothetical protein